MTHGKLAILLPTHRNDAAARHTIETAASLAGDRIDVFISDSSGIAEKRALLRSLADRSPHCHVFCREGSIGVHEDWLFLMNQQDHEFVCAVSDADVFSPDYFVSGLNTLASDPKCVAASGLFISFARTGDQLRFEAAAPYEEATAVERIWNHANHPWVNATRHAVQRRAALKGFEAYIKDRPFHPGYMEQFQTIALLMQGTRLIDPKQQIFIHNNTAASHEAMYRASSDDFAAAGLPTYFKHFRALCQAVDIVHYLNSVYRPEDVGDEESATIARILHHRLMREVFSPYLLSNLELIAALLAPAPDAFRILQSIVETSESDVEGLIGLFSDFLRIFNGGLADRYRAFATSSLRSVTAYV